MDDLWLQEREPFFGHELEGVQRDPVSGKSKKRTDRCKQKHRTDLKLDEWAKFDYFRKANVNDLLGIDVAYPVSPQIDRVHQSRLSVQQFIDNPNALLFLVLSPVAQTSGEPGKNGASNRFQRILEIPLNVEKMTTAIKSK